MEKIMRKCGVVVVSMMLICGLFITPVLADESVIPVNRIVGIPTNIDAGEWVVLNGTIQPTNATSQTIKWKIKDSGGTGAQISENYLQVPVGGTIVITATIIDGIAVGTPYVQDFVIIVGKNDTQKIAIATDAVKKALSNLTATNETTKEEITNLVEKAISSTGVTRVSMSWSTDKGFTKVMSTTSSKGRIDGQIDLICNQRFTSILLNKSISMLPKENSSTNEETSNTQSGVYVKSDASKVEDVYVNNQRVDKSNYTIKKDTGEIVFKDSFINTLSSGYSVSTRNTDGELEVANTIENEQELNNEAVKDNQIDMTSIDANTKDVSKNDKNNIFVQCFIGLGTFSGLAIFYIRRKGII